MNKFILFDYEQPLVDEFQKEFGNLPNFECECIDVRKLVARTKFNYIVSPANSLGFMDGGIDGVYSTIFPGIQRTVQTAIKKYGIMYDTHFASLPIGSAIIVPTGHKNCPEMIVAPTMQVPENIQGTTNVYDSFMGILHLTKYMKNKTITIPGLGTGTGRISPDECAREMRRAYNDFMNKIPTNNQVLVDNKDEYVIQ